MRNPHRIGTRLAALALLSSGAVGGALGQGRAPYEGAPIYYHVPTGNDPVARLQAALEAGESALEWEERRGFVPSLLAALEVPVESQGLVFSRTSFQGARISPRNPRAVYFGDDVYVGWVPGAPVLELTAVDPRQGAIFYTLEQRATATPRFERQDADCLQCHDSSRTRGFPGHLVRSVHPDANGDPILRSGSFITDHESPLAERWGGWYVTGTHGDARHMGNATVAEDARDERVDVDAGANVTDLAPFIDTERYLAPSSDLVALMVFEHQTEMHNRIARASYATRIALAQQDDLNEFFDEPVGTMRDSTRARLEHAAEELLAYLLFRDEPPLEAPVRGTSHFAEVFEARGRRDGAGRSLRELDLEGRLFRYPCSFLIHSDGFRALPPTLLEIVYSKLDEVLTRADAEDEYPNLSVADRRAIREILLATLQAPPPAWQ